VDGVSFLSWTAASNLARVVSVDAFYSFRDRCEKVKLETLSVASLVPFDGNPRRHSDLQIREMIKSLDSFGQTRAIVVDENNVILAGHCIQLACQASGREKVDVLRLKGLTPAQKKKLVLADNKIGDLGADDYGAVMALIKSLDDFDIPGFDAAVLDEIINETSRAVDAAVEDIPMNYDGETAPVETEIAGDTINLADIEQGSPAPKAKKPDTVKTINCPHCGKKITL
jgi:hypothetical protein